jgi:hypothetical protein
MKIAKFWEKIINDEYIFSLLKPFLKKESRESLVLNTSFPTKKIFDFILYYDRVALEIRKVTTRKKICVVKLLYL